MIPLEARACARVSNGANEADEDGSTPVHEGMGEMNQDAGRTRFKGTSTVVSGTGRYLGTTGTVTSTGRALSPTDVVNDFRGQLTIPSR